MPCTDGGIPYPKTRAEVLEEKTSAMLCGVLRTFATQEDFEEMLSKVDWAEVGATRSEFNEWWLAHINSDRERLRAQALKKLSPAERQALGLKGSS